MNLYIKRILFGAFAVALVFPLAPADAFVPLKLKPELFKLKEKNTEEFCSKFSDQAEKIVSKLGEQETKVTGYLGEHKDNLVENREARDAELRSKREKADQNRQEWYARLEARADTDAEKDAVVKFKQTIETAVDVRQEAVDAAIEAFRKGVDDAVAGRKSSIESVRDSFKSKVESAVAQVKKDCENGETTATIRSNFKESLKAARESLKTDKKDVDKVGAQVKALAEARKKSIESAITTFKTTLSTAIADLKKSFDGDSQ